MIMHVRLQRIFSSEFVPRICTKATKGINVIMLEFNLIKKSNYINTLIELYFNIF